ncbi:hypothetical protein AUR64_11215 [Haloprofundus marisrubri]|uniref:GTPase HflX n=1 Tax=Haloprofundus marisrubri TaxID=1514971 RepID=A0A0W1R9X5_9EURY|nr:GTPase HflX [Haloprofundus marisrubri]KTG10155.1 hypothetical protein AUR64_11215 [Haloprofundus marisrubri]
MQQRTSDNDQSAIVAKRTEPSEAAGKTAEIEALADAAGYDVVETVTQTRHEDATYQFGRGKAEALGRRLAESDIDTIVFDNPLSPQQAYSLGELLPDSVAIVDRYRLILDIFAEQAGTTEAQLQVRLAELRYELPRVKMEIRLETEAANERRTRGGMDEKEHRRVLDLRERIQRVEAKLDGVDTVGADRRRNHRAAGRDIVALAGYTNAGKSTLLQRLAADLELGDNDARHADESETAAAEDCLFKTLDTTTRRGELDGREVLLTDTVGFVRDLPHWLVESFESTLSVSHRADVVVLVVDASDAPDEVDAKLDASLDTLDDADGVILPVLNKVDRLSADELTARRRLVEDRVSEVDAATDPVAVSATDATNLDRLRSAIRRELPTECLSLVLPNTGKTQAFVSWAHDHGRVPDIDYDAESVTLTFEGRPELVERAEARVD